MPAPLKENEVVPLARGWGVMLFRPEQTAVLGRDSESMGGIFGQNIGIMRNLAQRDR